MYTSVRKHLISRLWAGYRSSVPFYKSLFPNHHATLDHLAIIDLPSEHSGIKYLSNILIDIGYEFRGEGYIPEKQNPFQWLAEKDCDSKLPHEVLPQIVIADFDLSALPKKVTQIIETYAAYSKPIDTKQLEYFKNQLVAGSANIHREFADFIYQNLIRRPWPLPTHEEYQTVKEANELIAWVLVFGRAVNHFGVSIHMHDDYNSLEDFNNHALKANLVKLNSKPSIIKGDENSGIEQSSSEGLPVKITLADSEITLPNSFMEFIWRYPIKPQPKFWGDFYSDFIAQNANFVIESLYENK